MISLLKVYRVNGLSGRTGALSSVYPLVDCRASARENKWTRLKKTLRIIRHDPPSFSSRNVNNVNFYLQLDRNSANWLPIHHTEYTIIVFEIVCSTWRHFSTMSSSREVPFLQPWIRTRTNCVGRRIDRYGGAISPGSGEPNHLRARKNRRFRGGGGERRLYPAL